MAEDDAGRSRLRRDVLSLRRTPNGTDNKRQIENEAAGGQTTATGRVLRLPAMR